jgi:hypothetical protein
MLALVPLVGATLTLRAHTAATQPKKDRASRRAQKIRTRLGDSANMMEPFPEKPKGMHHDTYMKLLWEHHEAEMEQLAGAREWLDKLQKQVS